jgi:rod shape-determining protein MreC
MFFLPALHPWKRTPAIAISVKPSIQRDTAVLQLAAGASGAPRDVVVDLSGNLVGQVTKTTRGICDLLLVTDMQFSSGAKIVQTGRGQSSKVVIGICEGNRGDTVVLSDMPIDADVRPGDLVETSGLGSVFPAGLPLGTVVSVSADPARSIKSAVVRVNADLNDLHEVYVLQ